MADAVVDVPCRNGDRSQLVPLEHVTEEQLTVLRKRISVNLATLSNQDAIEESFRFAVSLCPNANPSDLWRHVVMQEYIAAGHNDNSWKKASGKAFEYAFVNIYNPLLVEHSVRLRVLTSSSARIALDEMIGVAEAAGVDQKVTGSLAFIAPSKLDVALDGFCPDGSWRLFGIAHLKTSIAERIKDDAPASLAIRQAGYFSALVTLDHKCYPVPHGDGINYGELGARTREIEKVRQKRAYVEVDGDFDVCSYNLRTPQSPAATTSGARIKTLKFYEENDSFVADLVDRWNADMDHLCAEK